MMSIVIKYLSQSKSLDSKAMVEVKGGMLTLGYIEPTADMFMPTLGYIEPTADMFKSRPSYIEPTADL